MSDFQILSDGACDLSRNIADKYSIEIVPFYVSFDSIKYEKEIDELSLHDFYKEIQKDNVYPKTSLPSVQDYIDAFTKYLDKGLDIICYTITDKLSGSLQSALTAKSILEEQYKESKILICNSWQATGCQSLMILEAARMREAGLTIDEVFEKSEKSKGFSRIMFMVGSLKYLEHGGRIGKLASISGNILNIKPLIELKNGEISLSGIARSRKSGLKKLLDITQNHFKKSGENMDEYLFTLGTTNNTTEKTEFFNILSPILPKCNFSDFFDIGATIASHTGPETIGLCFVKKYEFI